MPEGRQPHPLTIGTPLSPSATKVMLLGSGELGKEVVIALQRLGVEVVAVDRYANAPGHQVAHRAHVIAMTDGAALRRLIEQERPQLVVPEIEAIATDVLVDLEREGAVEVIPTARAVKLTMNREGIRRLAAEDLGLPTSAYRFADSLEELRTAIETTRGIGYPCLVKPVMSSSGKGQTLVRAPGEVAAAWQYAESAGRVRGSRVIVEGYIDFDYEITLLTVRHGGKTTYCEPIGHLQIDGDYRESWQPQPMSAAALAESQRIAHAVTAELGGNGIFGVELFVAGDTIYFSEVSPRPHDTGLVTLISQDLSEFALHARAILGLPIPVIRQRGPSASCAILVDGDSDNVRFENVDRALTEPDTALRLFGKPEVRGHRRMGVSLALGATIDEARATARKMTQTVLEGVKCA